MSKKSILTAAALVAATSLAHAGTKSSSPVHLDLNYRTAWGSLGDARNSNDTNSYIDCATWASPTAQGVSCEVRDAAGRSIYAWTNDPKILQIAGNLVSDSYINVTWNSSNQITYLYVTTGSMFAPKLP
jgi:hypothetical protein